MFLGILFFVIFLGFTGYILTNGSIAQFTRADIAKDASLQKSLIFAWPMSIAADGNSAVEITIFARNENNEGMAEKSVKIITSVGVVKEGEQLTGPDGKAVFHISSSASGIAEISAFIDNRRLLRDITVEFK